MIRQDGVVRTGYGALAEEAATVLCAARLQRERFDRFPPRLVPANEAEAYAVQDLLHLRLAEQNWGHVVGHKIGCTTPVMQAYLDIHNPCAGGVFDTTVRRERGRFSHARFLRVGVECEIAVRLRSPLSPQGAPFDRESAASAVGACMAAIEIVEDRYVDYPSLDTPTLIADDFFNAGCVLGREFADFSAFDLPAVTASISINSQEVGTGVGTDVLGHPLDALVWLADNAAARDSTLHAGEFVILGSLVQTNWVEAGDEVVIVNDPLGEVRVTFE